MAKWKDITSYSRGGDNTPHWWQLDTESVRIAVGNSHIYYPDGHTWLVNCEPWYRTHALQAKDELAAKSEALSLVTARLQAAITALSE
jgi:hypothetical protein